jgi:hypothetical protein
VSRRHQALAATVKVRRRAAVFRKPTAAPKQAGGESKKKKTCFLMCFTKGEVCSTPKWSEMRAFICLATIQHIVIAT